MVDMHHHTYQHSSGSVILLIMLPALSSKKNPQISSMLSLPLTVGENKLLLTQPLVVHR